MSIEALDLISEVERTANCEELPTLIFFKRLKNPRIRQQILDLLCAQPEVDEDYIEKTLDEAIKTQEKVTTIEMEGEPRASPHLGQAILPLCWKNNDGSQPTTFHKAIVEAHEKGHVIRPYYSREIQGRFIPVLDEESILANWPGHEAYENKEEWIEDLWGNYDYTVDMLDYITSPLEIAERMSQLKNYFGMDSDQEFTKAHLDYARAHYIEDTGFDNNMTMFFSGITPETEGAFLEVINTCGI